MLPDTSMMNIKLVLPPPVSVRDFATGFATGVSSSTLIDSDPVAVSPSPSVAT